MGLCLRYAQTVNNCVDLLLATIEKKKAREGRTCRRALAKILFWQILCENVFDWSYYYDNLIKQIITERPHVP